MRQHLVRNKQAAFGNYSKLCLNFEINMWSMLFRDIKQKIAQNDKPLFKIQEAVSFLLQTLYIPLISATVSTFFTIRPN